MSSSEIPCLRALAKISTVTTVVVTPEMRNTAPLLEFRSRGEHCLRFGLSYKFSRTKGRIERVMQEHHSTIVEAWNEYFGISDCSTPRKPLRVQ